MEGTGSYGAGLTRYLTGIGIEVVEVKCLSRQLRRRLGKTDTTDAQAAGRAALNGQAHRPTQNRRRTGRWNQDVAGSPTDPQLKARTEAISRTETP